MEKLAHILMALIVGYMVAGLSNDVRELRKSMIQRCMLMDGTP